MPSVRGNIALTDDAIAGLPFAKDQTEWWRDAKLSAFMLCVTKTRKVFRFETERRHKGKRETISRKLGTVGKTKAADAR